MYATISHFSSPLTRGPPPSQSSIRILDFLGFRDDTNTNHLTAAGHQPQSNLESPGAPSCPDEFTPSFLKVTGKIGLFSVGLRARLTCHDPDPAGVHLLGLTSTFIKFSWIYSTRKLYQAEASLQTDPVLSWHSNLSLSLSLSLTRFHPHLSASVSVSGLRTPLHLYP